MTPADSGPNVGGGTPADAAEHTRSMLAEPNPLFTPRSIAPAPEHRAPQALPSPRPPVHLPERRIWRVALLSGSAVALAGLALLLVWTTKSASAPASGQGGGRGAILVTPTLTQDQSASPSASAGQSASAAPSPVTSTAPAPSGSTGVSTTKAATAKPTDKTGDKALKTGLIGRNDFPSGMTTTLRWSANGKYVRAEINYAGDRSGMLRAASSSAAASEQFTLTWSTDHAAWTIRSNANGLFVSAEVSNQGNQYGMLRARAGNASGWEFFSLYRFSDGTYALRSSQSGMYVSAELGYSGDEVGMLRARSRSVSSRERLFLS